MAVDVVRPRIEGEVEEGRACLLAMRVCIHMHVISGNFTAARPTGRLTPFSLSLLFSYILRSFVSPRGAPLPLPPFLINSQRDPGVISCLGCFDLTERRRRVYTPHWQKTRQGREKWESVNASEQRDD